MKLSILIPTVYSRWAELARLLKVLILQAEKFGTIYGKLPPQPLNKNYDLIIASNNVIELVIIRDNKELTLGEKRESLYKICEGEYAFMIDDDDSIAPNAIEKILAAIENKPDCITFRENCMMNGVYKSSNHSLKYERWQDNHDGYDYVRTPFYKDVIKTEIARSVPFPYIRWNEDEIWSGDLYKKLQTEVHIDEEIYFYIYNSQPNDFNNRYGIKQ